MNDIKLELLSNSELKIKLTEMENEYEHIKDEVNTLIHRMEELDNTYDKVKKILNKRTRGIAI